MASTFTISPILKTGGLPVRAAIGALEQAVIIFIGIVGFSCVKRIPGRWGPLPSATAVTEFTPAIGRGDAVCPVGARHRCF